MNGQKKLLIKLSSHTHKMFKVKCAEEETDMQSKIVALINLYINDKIVKKEKE